MSNSKKEIVNNMITNMSTLKADRRFTQDELMEMSEEYISDAKKEIINNMITNMGILEADRRFTQDELMAMAEEYISNTINEFVSTALNRMTRREAMAKTSELLAEARLKISEAEVIAQDYGIELTLSLNGMSGTFEKYSYDWSSSSVDDDDEEWQWVSSSTYC